MMGKILALLLVFPLFFALFLLRVDIIDSVNYDLINQTQTTLDNSINISPEMRLQASNLANSYENPFAPYYDIVGGATIFLIIIMGCWSAFKDATIGHYTFFSLLFFGTLFFLFATAIFSQISDYFFLELLPALNIAGLENYPIMNFYYSNIFWVNMVGFMAMIVCRKFEIFNFTSGGGAKEE